MHVARYSHTVHYFTCLRARFATGMGGLCLSSAQHGAPKLSYESLSSIVRAELDNGRQHGALVGLVVGPCGGLLLWRLALLQ
jgi:hypothetical protein